MATNRKRDNEHLGDSFDDIEGFPVCKKSRFVSPDLKITVGSPAVSRDEDDADRDKEDVLVNMYHASMMASHS